MRTLECPPLGLEQHPEKHGYGPRHSDLSFQPKAYGRTADADGIRKVCLGPVTQRAHVAAQFLGRHGSEAGIVHAFRSRPFPDPRF